MSDEDDSSIIPGSIVAQDGGVDQGCDLSFGLILVEQYFLFWGGGEGG